MYQESECSNERLVSSIGSRPDVEQSSRFMRGFHDGHIGWLSHIIAHLTLLLLSLLLLLTFFDRDVLGGSQCK